MLVEEIGRIPAKIPQNLEVLLSSLDQPDINDYIVALLYTLMIETGFVPADAQNTDDNVSTCFGFNVQKLKTYVKMPDGWKKPSGNPYEISFAPVSGHKCKLLILTMEDLLLVDLFIERHLDPEESIFVSCFSTTVCPSGHVTLLKSAHGKERVKYKNIVELAHKFKDIIASPARACIMCNCGVANPSLLGLPQEVTIKILTYLKVKDVSNLSQTCSFLNALSKDQHLWYRLVNRDFKLNERWNNDANWRLLYEQKEIKRIRSEMVSYGPTSSAFSQRLGGLRTMQHMNPRVFSGFPLYGVHIGDPYRPPRRIHSETIGLLRSLQRRHEFSYSPEIYHDRDFTLNPYDPLISSKDYQGPL